MGRRGSFPAAFFEERKRSQRRDGEIAKKALERRRRKVYLEQDVGRVRSWPGWSRLAFCNCGLAAAMQVHAVPWPRWAAASFQSESPVRTVMLLGGCTRGWSSVMGTTSTAPGWRRLGFRIAGLLARNSLHREPLPNRRRANFQRESPN